MIHYKTGDILDVKEGVIVHGCNAQRVMGAGVALAIRNKYPPVYTAYVEGSMALGSCTKEWATDDLLIINGITQQHFGRGRRFVNYAAICRVFNEAVATAHAYDYSLNFPKIGAGLGGGDWKIIEQLICDCDPDDSVVKICWSV